MDWSPYIKNRRVFPLDWKPLQSVRIPGVSPYLHLLQNMRNLLVLDRSARQLDAFTADLAAEERTLAERRHQINELLASVLPPRLVDAVHDGALGSSELLDGALGSTERLDDATVVVLTVEPADSTELEPAVAAEVASELERTAVEIGLERTWSSADRHLYLAGLDTHDDARIDLAVRFVAAARDAVHRVGEVGLRGALSAGQVAAGVIDDEHVSLGVWGTPVRRALALDAMARPGEILVDAETASRVPDDRDLEPRPLDDAAVEAALGPVVRLRTDPPAATG